MFNFNPFTPKSDFIDFTLSNARRFYSSKGDSLGVKGLNLIFTLTGFLSTHPVGSISQFVVETIFYHI